jgi:hypothetical protein
MTTAAAASDNAIMQWVANVTARAGLLRVANIAARTAVLAFVGLITFTSSWPAHTPHRGAQVTLQVVAFTVSAVLMAAWAAVDFLPKLRPRCVPWILGTIALVSGAAAATKTGGNFGGLALIAAISAGSADSLVVGWVVAGLGVLGFESLALPWGTDIWGLIGYPGYPARRAAARPQPARSPAQGRAVGSVAVQGGPVAGGAGDGGGAGRARQDRARDP